MISEFETRLADALGTRIGDPFTGRVDVAPGGDPGAGVRVVLGVTEAQTIEPDLGSRRFEVVPGDAAPRRAMRMRCTVSLEVRAATADRAQQMKALDAALYALDGPDFRNGVALADGTDRGFVIHDIRPSRFGAPLDPKAKDIGPVAIDLVATGLFWPIGAKGEAGKIIGEIHFRGGVVPLEVVPAEPLFTAGGNAAVLTIRFGTTAMNIKKDSTTSMPFDVIAVTLVAPGGKPGKGTLSGGAGGATPAVRLLTVTKGEASVTYTPPAAPAVDELVVAFDNGAKALGIELGRTTLTTRSGA